MKDALLAGSVFSVLISLFLFAANDWEFPWKQRRPADIPWCEPHDVALDRCETCNPALARGGTQVVQVGEPDPDQCPNTFLRINLGEGVAEQIGLETFELEERPIDERLRVNAQTTYVPDRHARVAPRLPGVIREVRVRIGNQVDEETVLAVLECPELGRAQSDYLQALATQGFWQKIYESREKLYPKVTTLVEMTEAETELSRSALEVQRTQLRLQNLGLGDPEIAAILESGTISSLLELRPAFAGVVVDMSAVAGEMAGPDRPLFGVADLSRMWLTLDLYEHDLARVEPGQRVSFFVEGLTGRKFPGSLVALAGEVDPRTRTVKAFADVKNVQGLLRANMFGEAEIRIRSSDPRLLVPREAVQNDGDCLLAFVSPSENVFLPRKLEVGAAYQDGFEVLGGLAAGERVATTGSFLLKTEILRGQIGAG